MTIEFIILSLIGLTAYSFFIGRKKALALSSLKNVTVHSQPYYHGLYSALITIFPAFILLILWSWIESSIFSINLREYFKDIADPAVADFYILGVINFAGGIDEKAINHVNFMSAVNYYESTMQMNLVLKAIVIIILTLMVSRYSLKLIAADFKARDLVEIIIIRVMKYASIFAIVITIGIVLSLLFETIRFFESVAVTEFLFGTHWSPQMSIREGQVGSSGSFGAVPVFTGTLLISFIAMLVAGPIGLFSAIYLSQYASINVRLFAKPIIEVLAGIPTVVYGFFCSDNSRPFFSRNGHIF